MAPAPVVLYVGLDPADRSGITSALARSALEFEAVAEPDAEAALSYLEGAADSVDCIVSAYHLAGADGVEFHRKQTDRAAGPAAPLVLFVTDGSEATAASAVDAGVSGYVRRNQPDATDRLADAVRDALDTPRSRDAPDADTRFESCRAELRWERERLEETRRVLSHDLRSPLNVAKGYAQYVSAETDALDDRGSNDPLSEITTALDRLDSFLDDLNVLIRQGRPVVSPEPVALAATARTAWERTTTKTAQLRLLDDDPPLSTAVVADRERTLGLFRELYANAVDHGPPGVTVTVGPLSEGFYVTDDGPGISESKRADVFRAGMADSDGRNGIGLARVKHIAAAHRWAVSVADGPDGGVRVEVTGVESAE